MNANTASSARVIEVCYETNRAIVRFEGMAPEVGAEALVHPQQCGWVDEFGNVFPMGAWKPAKRTWQDTHKANWQPVYRALHSGDDQTHE